MVQLRDLENVPVVGVHLRSKETLPRRLGACEERDQRIAQRRGVKRIESKIDWLEIDLFYLQRCARASICD